jgi:imidazolonepropionase-like amidohydrolase
VGEGNVVDLRNAFVLPGLIDSHVHITAENGPTSRLDEVTKSSAEQAMDGAGFARRRSKRGSPPSPTSAADNDAVFALRKAISEGKVAGRASSRPGAAISVHGGHGDTNGFRGDINALLRPPSVCSGPDDCRRAVRQQVQAGADVIKITATAACSPTPPPARPAVQPGGARRHRRRRPQHGPQGHRPRPRRGRHCQLHEGGRRLDRARHLPRR